MIKLSSRTQFSLLLIPAIALLVSSQSAMAQVYKWQDERGMTQYSDKKPQAQSSKATPGEVVNSLQAKDLCTIPQAATQAKATKIAAKDLFNSDFLSANFFSTAPANNTATATPAVSTSAANTTAAAKTAAPSPTVNTASSKTAAAPQTLSSNLIMAAVQTTGATTTSWVKCADQFQSCQFQGQTKKVRYGNDGKYLYGTFSNYIGCSDSAFKGDPLPKAAKVCEVETIVAAATSNTTAGTSTSGTTTSTSSTSSTSTASNTGTTGWLKCANQFQSCQFSGSTKTVRYGGNGKYFQGTFANYVGCSDSAFKGDPAPNVAKVCEVQTASTGTSTSVTSGATSGSKPSGSTTSGATTGSTSGTTSGTTTGSTSGSSSSGSIGGTLTNIIQKELMPAVNIALNVAPVAGFDRLIVKPTSEQPTTYEFSDGGAVRIDCNTSHMGNNDPIVFPNQAGAAHHHTFFGNTSVNEKTTHASLMTSNSTCSGGTMNRSAYWVPSMINTKTNAPIAPVNNIAYYKTSKSAEVTVPPEGLRMIAGNQKATTPFSGNTANWRFTCNEDYRTHADHIPDCANGGTMEYMIIFPECWNGKDLDSPNHQDHMAYPTGGDSCPASHPVRIPQIAFNIHYKVNDANGTKYWRLASDNYSTDKPGGYSAHGDWMEGWDRAMIKRIVNSCLKAHKDCHAHLVGDGYMFDKY